MRTKQGTQICVDGGDFCLTVDEFKETPYGVWGRDAASPTYHHFFPWNRIHSMMSWDDEEDV